MTTCTATRADGLACTAHALDGETFCFTHHPTRANERAAARKAGGHARVATRLPANAPNRTLRTADDVRSLLSDAVTHVLQGELDGRTANAVGYLCSALLKAIQIVEVEERLRRIEAAARPGEVIGLIDRDLPDRETPLFGDTSE